VCVCGSQSGEEGRGLREGAKTSRISFPSRPRTVGTRQSSAVTTESTGDTSKDDGTLSFSKKCSRLR